MLQVKNLDVYYGDLQALFDCSFEVGPGEIVALLGVNGSGKSTAAKAISGLIKNNKGSIEFNGKHIEKMPPYSIVSNGLIQVPEGRQLFPFSTVRENLELGAYSKKSRGDLRKNLERVYELFPRLKEREKQMAGTMSGGEQQMCAIGRGIMSNPKLLILDEPTLGLAPLLVKQTFEIIKDLQKLGITILLIEQNIRQSLEIVDRAYLLNNGKVVSEGTSQELINDDEFRKNYFGI